MKSLSFRSSIPLRAADTLRNTEAIKGYRWRRWRIKLLNWEYWPVWAVYVPYALSYLWHALRVGNFFYYTAANPAIEQGGMFFESKARIFDDLPEGTYPKTVFIPAGCSIDAAQDRLATHRMKYPLVAKPDRGERGWAVKVLEKPEDLATYMGAFTGDFLLQAYVDYPEEYSIFYVKQPGSNRGQVTSITRKELLRVKGDGHHSLEKLILASDRAFLQWLVLRREYGDALQRIPSAGESVLLVPYGNHCRGARFIDESAHASAQALAAFFDSITERMEGYHYMRFDLKCRSLEELRPGGAYALVEVNGAGAEPAHIYAEHFPFMEGQRQLLKHLHLMQRVSRANHRLGHRYGSASDFLATLRRRRAYQSLYKC